MAANMSNTSLVKTFYDNDYDDRDYEIMYIHDTIYWTSCIMICIDVPLTLIAIYALFSLALKNRAAPVYAINLLIADLIQLCGIIADTTFYFNRPFILPYIYSLMARVGFMVCLSLDRYMTITPSMKYCFMSSIKSSLVICVVIWCLPLVFLLPFIARVNFHVTESIFALFFFLPLPLFIFFLGGTLRALPASISVPLNEKRQSVGILVLVLLIYVLFFLPGVILFMAKSDRDDDISSYENFVSENYSGLKNLPVFFIRLGPLADLVLCVFMSKETGNKLLASLPCCKNGEQ